MEKRISTRELAAVKRTAMNVAPIVAKKNKAKSMIEKWTEEYNVQESALAGYESGLMAQLGLRTEQVVTKVVESTGKVDKNGKEIKTTKYVINDNVRFDSEKGEYIVTLPDADGCCNACAKMEYEPEISAEDIPMEPMVEEPADEPVMDEPADEPAVESIVEEQFSF